MIAAFGAPVAGLSPRRWVRFNSGPIDLSNARRDIRNQQGWDPLLVAEIPLEAGRAQSQAIDAAAQAHVLEIWNAKSVERIRGADRVPDLTPFLRQFLSDHPDPDRTVFMMMRFHDTPQFKSIEGTIRAALADRGYKGVRADDRDYTGELWTNLRVYMTGCHLGVAVFEDIDDRDFNPNIALELGYMLANDRRCLLLKEKRLPALPTDVLSRLYKPFDAFEIPGTIAPQIHRWIDVDIGPSS